MLKTRTRKIGTKKRVRVCVGQSRTPVEMHNLRQHHVGQNCVQSVNGVKTSECVGVSVYVCGDVYVQKR